MDLSLVQIDQDYKMGPLGLGLQLKAWTTQHFDVDLWAQLSLQTLSDEELKESPLGRDLIQTGVTFNKNTNKMFFENRFVLRWAGSAEQKIANMAYEYKYGPVYQAGLSVGWHWRALTFGVYADLYLGERFKVESVGNSTFSENFGRYRLLSGGPLLSYSFGDLSIFAKSNFLLSKSHSADFNFLGDLMGPGVSHGFTSFGVMWFF